MDKKIFIGADIVPTETNYELFKLGNVNELIGKELFHKLKQADFIIMNLETPLCDSFTPIPKCGPNLCAPENTIVGLSKINPYFFTLANNHILDQGENGLRTTINNLRKYNIEFAGAGENLFEAERAYV